ncbi:hypothetical protein [Microcoleus sp. herbarium12]
MSQHTAPMWLCRLLEAELSRSLRSSIALTASDRIMMPLYK